MKVNWTEPALEDLEAIQAYVAKDASTKLESFPDIGRRVLEADERTDIRELIFQGYRIIYLTQLEHITIIAVIHGSRDLAGMEGKP